MGHNLAIKSDGTLWAWGFNGGGQIGDGTKASKNMPVRIGSDTDWTSAAAGLGHSLAIKNDGSLWAWGANNSGELGDGTSIGKSVPVRIGTDGNWARVSAGRFCTAAIKSDGTLWAWGRNSNGQLGNGTTTAKSTPVRIGTGTNWSRVSTSADHMIAMKSDGTLWAWGANSEGQLGDGTTTDKSVPVQIGSDTDWAAVTAGESCTFAIKDNGTLWSWGKNSYGQLTDTLAADAITPVRIGADTDWVAIAAGDDHALAIKSNDTVWAWGANSFGQLGNGMTTNRSTPVRIGADTNWASVTAGFNETFAIKVDGSLWAWGNNDVGQFGDGTTAPRKAPVRIGEEANWVTISTGGYSTTVAIKSDGTLWAWGNNDYGQLGDGTTTDQKVPVRIGLDVDWATVLTGGYSTVAIKKDGTLWAWGNNDSGQLGDGTTTKQKTPVRIGADTDWGTVSTTGGSTVAIKKDGTLWAWGVNNYGQLGDGTTTDKKTPVRIGLDADWATVSTGGNSTVAIKKDGTLWAWGVNNYGQLGDGTTTPRSTPVRIGSDTDWLTVTGVSGHTVAIKSNATLWTWGANSFGQLGDGTTTDKTTPQQIGTGTTWATVSTGRYYHTVAVKSDGTLWAWGNNDKGQLGDGRAWREKPVQVFTENPPAVLLVTKGGSGSGTVTPSSGALEWSDNTGEASYPPGGSVTLTATAAPGSTFASWTGCASTSGTSCTVTMASVTEVTAEFDPPDTTAPTITGFTIPTASASTTIGITAFTATDKVAVTGYRLSESDSAPQANDGSWSATPPATYTFASPGEKDLFAWTKDGAGNISAPQGASVVIGAAGGVLFQANDTIGLVPGVSCSGGGCAHQSTSQKYLVVIPEERVGLLLQYRVSSQSTGNLQKNSVTIRLLDQEGNELAAKSDVYDSETTAGEMPGLLHTLSFPLPLAAGLPLTIEVTVLSGDYVNYIDQLQVLADSSASCEAFAQTPYAGSAAAIIENNNWGGSDANAVTTCVDNTGWYFNIQNDNPDAVISYQEAILGYKPFAAGSTTTALPVKLADLQAADLAFALAGSASSDAVMNSAIEMWVTGKDTQLSAEDIVSEVMIWLDNKGMMPGGDFVKTVTVDGEEYKLYYTKNWSTHDGSYIAFAKTQPMTSGALPLHDFLTLLVDEGYLTTAGYLASVELGNEVIRGRGATTLKEFTVTIQSEMTTTLVLAPGWNLAGARTPVAVASTFADADTFTSVWKWQAATWAVYLPGNTDGGVAYAQGKGFTPLTAIAPGDGFWVNSAQATVLPLSGIPAADTSLTLLAGWNLISLKGAAPVSAASLAGEKSSSIMSLWAWENGNWSVRLPGAADGGNSYATSKGFALLDSLTPGQGFWVNASEAMTLP